MRLLPTTVKNTWLDKPRLLGQILKRRLDRSCMFHRWQKFSRASMGGEAPISGSLPGLLQEVPFWSATARLG